MPRVLHVATNLDLGGAQTSVALICAGLKRRGIDVHVAYSSRGGRAGLGETVLERKLRDADVGLHDVPSMIRSVHPLLDWSAFRSLRALIRELQPDIVHTHMSKAGAVGRAAAAAERVPHVLHTVRGWPFQATVNRAKHRIMVSIERWLARHTDLLLSVSEQLVRDGLAHRIGRAERYLIVRSGVSIRDFNPNGTAHRLAPADLGIPDHAPVVGSVMGLTPQKAPLEFVATCAVVAGRHPSAHFIVVGDGPLRDAVLAAVARAGLGDRFHLLGLRRDVPDVLRLMSVFLLTSRWEGLARVLVEAAVAGVPIVATDTCGTRDVIDHGRSGFVAPIGDIDRLAAYVGAILTSETDALDMATNASRKITEEFDIETVISRHQALYDTVVSNGQGG